MSKHRRTARAAAGALALLVAGSSFAQPGPGAGHLRLLTWSTPLGAASSDSRFVQLVNIPMVHDPYGTPSYKTGTEAGEEAANEVLNRGLTSQDQVWIYFEGFAKGRSPYPTTGVWGDGQTIFFHVDDDMTADISDPPCLHLSIKPWIDNGVESLTGMKAWSEAVIAGYRDIQDDYPPGTIPDIGFVYLDSEVNFADGICSHQEIVDLFVKAQADPRYGTQPLYGFGGQTLEDLFDAAVIGGMTFDPGEDRLHPSNRGWYNWLVGVCNRIQNYGTYVAFYEPFYNEFGAFGGDYEATTLADGSNPTGLFGRDRFYHETNSGGGDWKEYILSGPHAFGAPTPRQTPVMYTISSQFYDPMIFNPPWGGACTYPSEPIYDCQVRANMQYYRDMLNTCMVAYGPFGPSTIRTTDSVVPWISIPNHHPAFGYLPGDYLNLVALGSGHGFTSWIVWTNPQWGTSPGIDNDWTAAAQAFDWAYIAAPSTHTVTEGTESAVWAEPVRYANRDPLIIEAEQDGSVYVAEVEIDFDTAFPTLTGSMRLKINTEAWLSDCVGCTGMSVFTAEIEGWDLSLMTPAWVPIGSSYFLNSFDEEDPKLQSRANVVAEDFVHSSTKVAKLRFRVTSSGNTPFNLNLDMVQIIRTE